MKEGGFSALLCDLGFHKFDTWKYINEKTCEKRSTCSVCGKILPNSKGKIEHSWTKSYLRDKSCEKQEICSHCGERRGEIIVEHTWLESYIGENSNKKRRECSRCFYQGAIQTSQSQWSWVFENGDKRTRFLSLQNAIQQVSLSNDIFSVSNNSRDKQVRVIEMYLPDTNLKTRGLNIGDIDFMFYPDGIHAYQNKNLISIMLYSELSFDVSKVRVENSNVPRDGEIVGQTWLHSKKDGGRDLRYADNPTISIIAYALFLFGTSKDGKHQIAISNSANAQRFYNELNGYLNSYLGRQRQNANSNSYQQDNPYSNDSHKSNRSSNSSQNESSGKLTYDTARKILGVSTGASQVEVRKAYLELVQKYHPDKVFHLADEYKVIAENKMKEINAAYMLLKESV